MGQWDLSQEKEGQKKQFKNSYNWIYLFTNKQDTVGNFMLTLLLTLFQENT